MLRISRLIEGIIALKHIYMLYIYIKIIHQWFTSRRHKPIKQNENAVRCNLESNQQDPLMHPAILAMNERQRADLPLSPGSF